MLLAYQVVVFNIVLVLQNMTILSFREEVFGQFARFDGRIEVESLAGLCVHTSPGALNLTGHHEAESRVWSSLVFPTWRVKFE